MPIMPDRRIRSRLILVAIVMLALMTAYEWFKQLFFPSISIWGSHIVTILFTSMLATTTFYFVLKQHHTEYSQRIEEISKRRESEAALKESQEQWHNVVNNAMVGFYQVTMDGDFIRVNEKLAAILRYDSAADLLQHAVNINQLYVDSTERPALIRHLSDHGALNQAEVRFKDREGRQVWVSLSVRVHIDRRSNRLLEGFVIDINQRKMVEAEKEKLYQDLKASLDQVRTLHGMIPICSSCKKIRDDKGYWDQIENYIMNHSEAQFSHSLCPECVKELYPKFRASRRSPDNGEDQH